MYNFAIMQRFADAGNLVNTTGNYVNAYTGAETAFGSGHTLAPELKTFYDTTLLENARVETFYAQFGKKIPLPAGNGKTVEFRKWDTFERATELKEGVIPTGQKFGSTSKMGTIKQYGTYTAISDELELRSYDDVILGATEEMGGSMAETQEVLIRDALMTNTNVLYCDNVYLKDDAEGGHKAGEVASTPTSPGTMEASATLMSKLTPRMIARAVTWMKKNRVPTIGGKYVAVIHNSVAEDLRLDKEWVEAHKYAATTEIFNGEIGELHGCRFIENPFAPVLKDTYKNKASGATYATYLFGKDSFGIIDPEGGAAQMIIKNKGQIGGPLEQFSTIGYKFTTNGATMLYTERLLRIMSCSSYSAIDEAN